MWRDTVPISNRACIVFRFWAQAWNQFPGLCTTLIDQDMECKFTFETSNPKGFNPYERHSNCSSIETLYPCLCIPGHFQSNDSNCIPRPPETKPPTECLLPWECLGVTEHFNYVICKDRKCMCKDGFSGNATIEDKCKCLPPNTVVYENSEALCKPPPETQPPETQPPTGCTERWECMGVSEHFNFVLCIDGKCKCRDGFSGNATTLSKCNCLPPNILSYEINEAICKPPPETQPPETQPPETQPPETQPPETQPPETQPPETQPPETQPPETQPPETQPPETQPPTGCTQQWECMGVSDHFNFVLCIDGKCTCKEGFSGNATIGNKCTCLAPNSVIYENGIAFL